MTLNAGTPEPEHKSTVLLLTAASPKYPASYLAGTLAVAAVLRRSSRLIPRVLLVGEASSLPEAAATDVEVIENTQFQTTFAKMTAGDSISMVVVYMPPLLLTESVMIHLAELRTRGIKIISVDWSLQNPEASDFNWVPSLTIDPELSETRGLFYGWEAFLVPKPAGQEPWTHGSKLLVITQGNEEEPYHEVLPPLLDRDLPSHFEIHWVRGLYAPVPEVPEKQRLNWYVHNWRPNWKDLPGNCNYALATNGYHLLEAICAGMPSVGLPQKMDRPGEEWILLSRAQTALIGKSTDDALAKLKDLFFDPVLCRSQVDAGLQRLDGKGPARFAKRLLSLLYEDEI